MSTPSDDISRYEKMLDYAYSKIPKKITKTKRFEIPRLTHHIISRRGPTVIYNFKDVCDKLNRDPLKVLKFISKELGTSGTFVTPRGSLKGSFDRDTLRRLVDRYSRDFIICPVCNGPDTRIIKEKRLRFLHCDACGAKSPVKAL